MALRLNPEILESLIKRTGKAKQTIRNEISLLRQKQPTLTMNAAAHIFALKNHTSVLNKLDSDDKESLKGVLISGQGKTITEVRVSPRKKGANVQRRLLPIIKYESENYFIKEHIKELSRAYSAQCYTAVIILFRKILENLIIDILRKKFPKRHDLIFNDSLHRYHDFSVILDNLYSNRNAFTHDGKTAIERLNQLVKPFKNDANNKTHSWFHIVKSSSEIENLDMESIIELIIILEKEVGIRKTP